MAGISRRSAGSSSATKTVTPGRRPSVSMTVEIFPKRLHQQPQMKTYAPTEEVDFVIIGSGAAGGVMARELSRGGFSVVVLEQGPWLTERDFSHDDFHTTINPEKSLTNLFNDQPGTARASAKGKTEPSG